MEMLWLATMPLALPRPVAAALVAGAYLAFCGWTWWRHRRLAVPAIPGQGVLVAYASQTGFAESLAERTAAALTAAGRPATAISLGGVDAAILAGVGQALFILATTGEGDAPDAAARFVSRTMAEGADLSRLRYGILALGDRDYAQFCAFGHAVDRWLRHQGAQPLFDLVEVDNGDAGALRLWQHNLGHLAGDLQQAEDWVAPDYAPWRLVARHLLNEGSPGGPVYHLRLQAGGGAAAWEAGDIAEIGPGNDPERVAALLAATGFNGREPVIWRGQETVLADLLAQVRLPADPALLAGWSLQQMTALEPLPRRDYSIASIPADGTLDLVVRQVRDPTGALGLGSGFLTRHAEVGEVLRLRVRRNSAFHLPAEDRPMILIGNGTGIAGLRAHMKARERQGRHRNWLLFGERTRAHDLLFAEELQRWQREGHLARLDLAFSRDQAQKSYVQDVLAAQRELLQQWVAEGACLYVCGSLEGMAGGVEAVLTEALGAEMLEDMAADRRYCRDVY